MNIRDNYVAVLERIANAAINAGRTPDEITLVVVTKTWPAEVVVAAIESGIRHFGENRPEELAAKRPEVESLTDAHLANDISWHAIGALQSRKTNLVADHADVFHALDRPKIARRLSRRLLENGRAEGRPLPVFVEVNVSGESTKAGVNCNQWEQDHAQRDSLLALAKTVADLPGLVPQGLMTMAPWQAERKIIRATFRRTCGLAEWLQAAAPEASWSKLSMGMTDDFEIAIEEGATHVRIGRAVFGERLRRQ
jgi:pyridoxal phosphate enzyme (YggS family)